MHNNEVQASMVEEDEVQYGMAKVLQDGVLH